MSGADPFDLGRFVEAQDAGGSYERALAELRRGRKESHWMWWVFPQVAGLGLSATSRRYAVGSLEEGRAYLRHPVLGARLRACAEAVAAVEGRTAVEVLGPVDAVKLRSSMTLFARADPDGGLWRRVLERYFAGASDPETDARLTDDRL